MKKILVALALLLAPAAYAQVDPGRLLTAKYNLNGQAADADLVVASAAIADSTTYVLAAQPDVARPLIIGITDADSSVTAGTLTITGLNDVGATITHVFTFAAGGTTTSTSTVYFKSVVSVITGVLTGEGAGDAVTVGTTTDIPMIYCSYGPPRNGSGWAKTVGSSVNVVSNTTSGAAFTGMGVGDLMTIVQAGTVLERVVVTYTSADAIVLNAAINLTGGYSFQYRTQRCGTQSTDGWIGVSQCENTLFVVDAEQLVMTGGVVATVYCKPNSDFITQVSVGTNTFATATPGVWHLLVDDPWDKCRLALDVGTSDDAVDTLTNAEIINAYVRCEPRS